MLNKIVDLYKYFSVEKPEGAEGYLRILLLDKYNFCENRLRPAMIIVPGGGYQYRSERESEPIAIKFLEKGYNVFILDYSISPIGYPFQLIEGAMAVAYVRENAKALGIDQKLIGAIGFSAGGHLCAMLATIP